MRILETERLILRRLTLDDLDDLARLYRDPEVRRYFPEGTLTREQTREELEWILTEYYGKHGYGLWATILKDTGDFIGRCGLLPWTIEGRFEVEVAYMLAREHWGRGLGTEAARGVLRHAFDVLGLERLIALIDRDNVASQKVAGHLGMTFEKEVRDDLGPALLYSVSRPAS